MVISPQNLEELHNKFNKIVKGEDDLKLSNRSLDVCGQMLADPSATSVKTISELADEFTVHRSFLTRLAQKLGFYGFPEFQAVFRKEMKGKSSFYTGQVEKYLQKETDSSTPSHSSIEEIAKTEWSNLLVAMENYDEKSFEGVIDSLINGHRVSILGLRGSYSAAHYLGYYLKIIRDDVTIAGMGGYILAEEISNLHPGDVLLAISVAPYTKSTVAACQMTHDLGVDVIVLTDSKMSPLLEYAKHSLLVSLKGDFFFTPMASLMIYTEAILTAFIRKSGDVAIAKLKTNELIFAKMDIESSKT